MFKRLVSNLLSCVILPPEPQEPEPVNQPGPINQLEAEPINQPEPVNQLEYELADEPEPEIEDEFDPIAMMLAAMQQRLRLETIPEEPEEEARALAEEAAELAAAELDAAEIAVADVATAEIETIPEEPEAEDQVTADETAELAVADIAVADMATAEIETIPEESEAESLAIADEAAELAAIAELASGDVAPADHPKPKGWIKRMKRKMKKMVGCGSVKEKNEVNPKPNTRSQDDDKIRNEAVIRAYAFRVV